MTGNMDNNDPLRLGRLCDPVDDAGIVPAPPFPGIDRMEARFFGNAFSPHRHDTYAIGVTLHGIQTFTYRGATHYSKPGNLVILHPDELHVSRRLAQQVRSSSLTLSFNQSFGEVVAACARPRRSQQGTWITGEMAAACERLHAAGWAHSVEVRDHNDLVGGLYGLCIGRVFFGESMFSAVPNTSKMAMIGLTEHMLANDLELIDCQVNSPHLVKMGARTIPRREFIATLRRACEPATRHVNWPKKPSMIATLLAD